MQPSEPGSTHAAGASPNDLLSDGPAQAWTWIAVASGQARLVLSGNGRSGDEPLALRYDFAGGGGFVVARRELHVELPETWQLRLRIRGEAPANTLEIKLADAAGTSVWRWKREAFAPAADWSELRIPAHEFEFAWGPAGGGTPARIGAIEIAVVAPPGGEGLVEVADLAMTGGAALRFSGVEASSCAEHSSAALAADGQPSSAWRSAAGEGPHTLTMSFAEARDVGGMIITWGTDARPRAFRIEILDSDGQWRSDYEATSAGAEVSFVPLAELLARALRIVAFAADAAVGVAVTQVELRPYGWSRSPSEFLTNVARASRRGAYPRYLLREQILWTPVATPSGGPLGLLSEDGAVEVGEGGFTIEPSLFLESDGGADSSRWVTWADVEASAHLLVPPLPLAVVRWRHDDVELEIAPFAEDREHGPRIVVRYRVHNRSTLERRLSLFVALRPFQVTPPWQSFRNLGGPVPLATLAESGGVVRVRESALLVASPPAAGFGATTFDAGGLEPFLSCGVLPPESSAFDMHERAEAALQFPLVIAASSFVEVFVACRPDLGADPAAATGDFGNAADDGPARLKAAVEAWKLALPLRRLRGPVAASAAVDVVVTATAHILACRDGAALQPGPRRYTRSWIRDGAIMAAALARAGRADAAREFVQWYAPFQRDDGFVPCCVDRDGVDPLVEHDSHGQLIHAVAETFRFTRDSGFVREQWPRCLKAAEYIEALRATRKTDEFLAGPRRACFGLLPESVSHEGYLSQPVHSYWDDFWALRGFRDAAFLAAGLGLAAEQQRWKAAALDLATAIETSMRIVMQERGLSTVPASVEWADFDPTAIAGAISLVGAAEVFPADALARTLDEYMRGLRARAGGSVNWSNYSPYEVRIVGALVRMDRRDDANELLDFLLGDLRPRAWNQWPEIVWRDAAAPAHLGDLPHCWIGAEYAFALRSMLVFERESDDALVIGAGLRCEWLDAETGIDVKGLPTWYGALDLSIRAVGDGGYRVTVGGSARPPGGFVAALPGTCRIDIPGARSPRDVDRRTD